MIEVTGIDHIVLRTNKPKEMLEFYCTVLGCKVEREASAGMGLIQLRAGNALIDLLIVQEELGQAGEGLSGSMENNMDHFCLQLKQSSEENILHHLQLHNVPAGEFAQRYGAQGSGPSIYITDPQGNTVELRSQFL